DDRSGLLGQRREVDVRKRLVAGQEFGVAELAQRRLQKRWLVHVEAGARELLAGEVVQHVVGQRGLGVALERVSRSHEILVVQPRQQLEAGRTKAQGRERSVALPQAAA